MVGTTRLRLFSTIFPSHSPSIRLILTSNSLSPLVTNIALCPIRLLSMPHQRTDYAARAGLSISMLWCTCTLVHLHSGAPALWCTCTLVHLHSGAPALWCTCTLVSWRVRVYHVAHIRYIRSNTQGPAARKGNTA